MFWPQIWIPHEKLYIYIYIATWKLRNPDPERNLTFSYPMLRVYGWVSRAKSAPVIVCQCSTSKPFEINGYLRVKARNFIIEFLQALRASDRGGGPGESLLGFWKYAVCSYVFNRYYFWISFALFQEQFPKRNLSVLVGESSSTLRQGKKKRPHGVEDLCKLPSRFLWFPKGCQSFCIKYSAPPPG